MNPIHLLSIEWSKFKNNNVVRMLLTLFIVTFPFFIFMFKEESLIPKSKDDGGPLSFLLTQEGIFQFPGIWEWMGYIGNWLVFFALGFVIVYTISIETSYKTMRQNIITGMTREQFFVSKFYIVVSCAILATLVYSISTLIIGYFHTAGEDISFSEVMKKALNNDWAVVRFFLMSFAYLVFAMFVGFAIKNSGLAVLTYLTYGILLEVVIRHLVHRELIDGDSHKYYPFNAAEDLMPMPMFKITPADAETMKPLEYMEAGITTVIYIIIFTILSYYIFKRKDL